MARETILAEQTITDFVYSEEYGCYLTEIYPSTVTLVAGEKYEVVWNGEAFSCEAVDIGSLFETGVAIGNGMAFGFSGNNEPFIIAAVPINEAMILVSLEGKTENTVAIYQEDANAIVLKDRDGNDVAYEGVTNIRVINSNGEYRSFTEGEALSDVEIPLDLSEGDQTITAPDGYLVKSAIIQKPSTLIPSNILKDVDIAGVVGTASGGGGGGSAENYDDEPEWIDDICFWDCDGTLIHRIPVSEAANLQELPSVPEHDGLTFTGWNYTLEELRAVTYPRDVGAMYTTSDGKTYIKLNITNNSYLAPSLNFSQTVDGGVSIDWGDGTAAETISGTGIVTKSHTYSALGEYEIVLTIADGCDVVLGGGSYTTSFIYGNNTGYRPYYKEIRCGKNIVGLNDYAIYCFEELELLVLPNNQSELPDYSLYNLYKVKTLTIPRGVTTIGNSALYQSGSKNLSVSGTILSLPETANSIGNGNGSNRSARRLILPDKITTLPKSLVNSYFSAQRVYMSDNVTTMGDQNFTGLNSLKKVKLPSNLTSVGTYFLCNCYQLGTVRIPDGLTTINHDAYTHMFVDTLILPDTQVTLTLSASSYLYIDRLIVKGTLSGDVNFTGSNFLNNVIYLSENPVGIITAKSSSPYGRRFYVPDNALDTYKALYDSAYDYMVLPLSEYPGTIPE